jgi:hypothetical protein
MEIVVKTDDGFEPLPEDKVVLSKSELETGYVSKDKVSSEYVMKASFEDRLNRAVSNQIDKAHEREDVIARVLETHTPAGADIDAAKEQWEAGRLKPLSEKYDRLRGNLRNSEVNAHAAEFFDEQYTRPLPNGKPSPMQLALGDQFEYNEEYGYVAAVDPAGNFIQSSDPTSAKPFRNVTEHISSLSEDPAWTPYLKRPAKNAGGAGGAGVADAKVGKTDPRNMSPEERNAWIASNGIDAWMSIIS